MTGREETIWESKPSQWLNFKTYCFCILMSLCVVIVMAYNGPKWWLFILFLYPAGRALFEWANLYFTSYKLTNHRFIYKEGIFNRITKELKPEDIKDLKLVEPWYERIVKIGDIDLCLNPYLDLNITVRGISKPEKVCDKFNDMRKNYEL